MENNEIKLLNIDDNVEIIPEKKAELEKNIFKLLDSIVDLKLKSHFEQFYRNKLWKLVKSSYKFEKNPIKSDELKTAKSKLNMNLIEKNERKICALLVKFPTLIEKIFNKYKIDILSCNFINEKSNLILSIIEKFINSKNNQNFLKELLEKNDLNNYINSRDVFLSDSYISSLTEEKSLEIINILLLEKQIMLLEFDLKEASEIGDVAKTKRLNDELLSLRKKKSFFLTNGDFI